MIKRCRDLQVAFGDLMAKSPLTEYRLELCSLLCMLAIFLTVVGVAGTFYSESLPDYLSPLEWLSSPFGEWSYWLVVIGPLLLVGAVWWLYDYVKKTRTLARLLSSPSKAKFVRNLDEIEYLAWSLPRRFEAEVLEMKRRFNIK